MVCYRLWIKLILICISCNYLLFVDEPFTHHCIFIFFVFKEFLCVNFVLLHANQQGHSHHGVRSVLT